MFPRWVKKLSCNKSLTGYVSRWVKKNYQATNPRLDMFPGGFKKTVKQQIPDRETLGNSCRTKGRMTCLPTNCRASTVENIQSAIQ